MVYHAVVGVQAHAEGEGFDLDFGTVESVKFQMRIVGWIESG